MDLISLPVCAYPETIDADIRSEKLSKLIIIASFEKLYHEQVTREKSSR